MGSLQGFVAYPSNPADIGQTIRRALDELPDKYGIEGLVKWEELDIAGRFITEPILEGISNGDVLVADITRLNFNVTYEVGFAIGQCKRVLLVMNSALNTDKDLIREVGIFDTIGYEHYQNAEQLCSAISKIDTSKAIRFDSARSSTPIYVALPPNKTDYELRLLARLKKARIGFRKFEPSEVGRLSATDAIDNVAESIGVVVPLLGMERADAVVHNLRGAFVAGLSMGMEKVLLLLQKDFDPIPIDYRDLVSSFRDIAQINEYINEFAPEVTELAPGATGGLSTSANVGAA